MDLTLSSEHLDLAAAARQLLATDVAKSAAFSDPPPVASDRRALLTLFEDFGLFQLNVRESHHDALASAQVVREVGAAAACTPAVSRLVARAYGTEGLIHAVANGADGALLSHIDVGVESLAVDIEGNIYRVVTLDDPAPNRRMAPFAAHVRLDETSEGGQPWLWAFHVVLSAFQACGALESALELTRAHITTRVQFGQPLASFQAVRNRVANIVVSLHGLRELCFFTLWRLFAKPDAATVDALMLRRYHLKAAREITLDAHQLHGALGYCYEYPLVALTLSLEFDRQVPLTSAYTMHELVQRFEQIETFYEELPPAWPLHRTDNVSPELQSSAGSVSA
jgi:alkylation response protein AidB-like acyl-CoA dehydrogenase